MAWNSENLATLFHEEYPNRHIQVSVAGLLVVVEDADTVFRATEDTPPLFPALMEGKERGGRGRRESGETEGVSRSSVTSILPKLHVPMVKLLTTQRVPDCCLIGVVLEHPLIVPQGCHPLRVMLCPQLLALSTTAHQE